MNKSVWEATGSTAMTAMTTQKRRGSTAGNCEDKNGSSECSGLFCIILRRCIDDDDDAAEGNDV